VTGENYKALGMQTLVDAIRSTGAGQPILLGGLSYANELSQWLAYEPSDPDHQLAASFHNYQGERCESEACWNSTIASLAEHVPVVTGEFDQEECPISGGDDPTDFDNRYMDWADSHGVSYLAWGWVPLEEAQPCGTLFLLTEKGEPAQPNGVALHDHLAALAKAAEQVQGTTGPQSKPSGGGTEQKPGSTSDQGGQSAEATGSQPSRQTAREGSPSSLAVALQAAIKSARLRRGPQSLTLHFRAPYPGTLRVRCSLRTHGGTVSLAQGSSVFTRAAEESVRLRLSSSWRRLLRGQRHPRLLLELTFSAPGRAPVSRRGSLVIAGH
jgi:hypothetical protein